jgi:hypothetical protein
MAGSVGGEEGWFVMELQVDSNGGLGAAARQRGF